MGRLASNLPLRTATLGVVRTDSAHARVHNVRVPVDGDRLVVGDVRDSPAQQSTTSPVRWETVDTTPRTPAIVARRSMMCVCVWLGPILLSIQILSDDALFLIPPTLKQYRVVSTTRNSSCDRTV